VLTPVTALYAGLLGLLVLILSYRVSRLRLTYRVGTGDGGHDDLGRAIRVQGNAMEYVPLGLVLLLLAAIGAAAAVVAADRLPAQVKSLTLIAPFFLQAPMGASARVRPVKTCPM
jgi:drug/metabolite transporter (DMT)-like permease